MLQITCSWNGQAFLRTRPDISSNDLAFFSLVLEILLMIGGVELNPGPVEEDQCQLCGTQYSTILQAVELREKALMEREKSILKREREADAKEEVLKKFADKPQKFEDELVDIIKSKKDEVEKIVVKINEQIKSLETRLFGSKSAEDDKDRIAYFEEKMLKTKIDDFYIIINSLMDLDMSLLVPNQKEVEHLKVTLELKHKLLEAQQKSTGEIAAAMMDFEMILQDNAQEIDYEGYTNPDKKLCKYCELPKSGKLQNCVTQIHETDDLSSFEVMSWPVEEKEEQAMKQMARDVVEHRMLNVPPQSPSVTQRAGMVMSNTYETFKYYSPLKSQSK